MMFERNPGETKKDHHKSQFHSKGFEPFIQSTLIGDTSKPHGFHGKMQHFQHGKTSGGSTQNKLIYGSHGIPLDVSNIKPKQNAPVSKYYQTPDVFRYGQNDFSNGGNGSKKMSTIFSLQERTSAELRKKQREAEETEKEYKRYLQEKENRRKEMEAEKRKDFDLQKHYKAPWGKAGGGAPNDAHKRTQNIHKFGEDNDHAFQFGRPGCGAPLKTNSGNLRAGLPADPEIRFQKRDRDQVYNIIAPERKSENSNPFTTNLDILAHETRERRNVLKRNPDMSTSVYDPFGRPGAGAPLRDDKGAAITARTMNLAKTVSQQDTSSSYMVDTSYGPYETPRLKKPSNNDIQGFQFGRGGGGAPITDKNGYVVTSTKQTLMNTNDGAVVKTDSEDSLRNRGGGGAPLRDNYGNLMTNVGGKWQADALGVSKSKEEAFAKQQYFESLRHQAQEHEQLKEREKYELNKPSTDTLSWLQQGKVGKPPRDDVTKSIVGAPRVTSDVIKQRFEMTDQDRNKLREYHEELDQHSKLWQQNRQQQTKQQREKSVEHAKTMGTIWGRPGCGAPNENSRRRKLDIIST